jgi:hypothetical protein
MTQFSIRIALSVLIGMAVLYTDSLASDISKTLQSFGGGPVKVRLYTDYFCGPCRAVEPELEPIISKLVANNKINLTFIDTPIHKQSALYARYFLYATAGMQKFEDILRVRSVLFEAAKENVTDGRALEAYLKQRWVLLGPFDEGPIFALRNAHLKSDNISSTPSCVVERQDKKEFYKGAGDIVNALKRLE